MVGTAELQPHNQKLIIMTYEFLWFEGLSFPDFGFSSEVMKEACTKFVIKDEDTVMVSYPKSGTHWLIEILCLIHSKGDTKWIQSVPIWERSPWIETDLGYKLLNENERPRLLTSHLPFHLFPKSLFTSKAKVLYLMRNPKDVLVSGYYFWTTSKHKICLPNSTDLSPNFLVSLLYSFSVYFPHMRENRQSLTL
uniref:Sulfotransferase n=1 Tax=Sciurus vulgaris TaxID=55149 RepID=A0A8D2D453_SCIVU